MRSCSGGAVGLEPAQVCQPTTSPCARHLLAFFLLVGVFGIIYRSLAADDWRPPPPTGNDGFDWIELKSGEWLKGKIKSLQDEKLEFDSEELDLHTFDWKDIRTLRSPRLLSVGFEKGKPVDGSLLVTSNKVEVINSTATNVYSREEVLAITPTGNRELSKWSGKLSAGLSFTSGNTTELDYSARATVQRRTPSSRLTLDYEGNLSRTRDTETENNQRGRAQFDYFLSRRLFARLPDIEYYHDPFQNIQHRLTVGAGAGYDIFHTPRLEWDVTASPSYQHNWFYSTTNNQSTSASAVAFVFGTHLDVELTKRLDLIFDYTAQLTGHQEGDNNHHAVATLEFEIRKHLKLDVSFTWDRIASPATESDGKTPKSDDFRLTTGLGVTF